MSYNKSSAQDSLQRYFVNSLTLDKDSSNMKSHNNITMMDKVQPDSSSHENEKSDISETSESDGSKSSVGKSLSL